ncbi:unnamed protein product [Penicillium salamii]|uniref:Alpha-1,6-mannosyltransferase subunit n=1 Tax=Penicillium salamii TaxID=1612424 RepID=A0A9W4JSD2_9EURO|nr:unnamed protein product [Penicillium salamii]CAG8272859.1 unnamed protein product [Penicillium salamii]CAG8370201.1 unnamed protein product [Penicillium salamii]CAG8388580.1 unnamed protein product [Penicillium salamii]CAG8402502.1 unnamed protein product [Penicillium salamii]
MTLSRSPSPRPGGGWSSPALNAAADAGSPGTFSPNEISWGSVKAISDETDGYPSFASRNTGFFSRQRLKISTRLSTLWRGSSHEYSEKDDHGPKWRHTDCFRRNMCSLPGISTRRGRFRLLVRLLILWIVYLLFLSSIVPIYRRSPVGGGQKFVIILGSNVEGGVMELKGAREWAIERNSIWNKKNYALKWGYQLELANLLAKKRYSHEWRESWEKGDIIREAMLKYPHAEWFWWLDLNTWIMEYDTSLQQHIFNNLESKVYRDITAYNPMNITHPLPEFWLDGLGRSTEGDGNPDSLNMLLSQDCAGFNLGSFFIRRSLWADRLLDAWWDPVMYEQMHMEWAHKEQDAFEYIYQSQPWVRSGVGFLPQRSINAFPPGACGDQENPNVHYQQNARDFVVNMAGCMFGRDCWSEIYYYRELSKWLSRPLWIRFKESVIDAYDGLRGKIKKT